jgi:hypothetical protein
MNSTVPIPRRCTRLASQANYFIEKTDAFRFAADAARHPPSTGPRLF